MTDDDLAQAEEIVVKLNEQWLELFDSVPPEVHMWDHLLDDLRRTRGMKYHQESFIERMHQEGKRMKRRFGGVRGGVLKKIDAQCQSTANKEAAQEKIEDVHKKSKRKLKNIPNRDAAEAGKRDKTSSILSQPTITGFQPLMDLQVTDRRVALMLEGLDAEEDEAQDAMYEQIEQDLEMMEAAAATEENLLSLLL